jgi:hypothetical protein
MLLLREVFAAMMFSWMGDVEVGHFHSHASPTGTLRPDRELDNRCFEHRQSAPATTRAALPELPAPLRGQLDGIVP